MLSAASTSGDYSGGQYYTRAPPRQPVAQRSRPFGSDPEDYTLLSREQARFQARDFVGRSSYGREPFVEEVEVDGDDGDDGDDDGDDDDGGAEGLGLRRVKSTWRDRGEGDDTAEASLAASGRNVARRGSVRPWAADEEDQEANGSVRSRQQSQSQSQAQQQKDPRKRKLSVMEKVIDFGRTIKQRTDSFVFRKDSGVEMQEESLPQVSCMTCEINNAMATTQTG
jgi:hypothetical protein